LDGRVSSTTLTVARTSALEAYPIDTSASKSSSNIFVGTASTFARVGFKEVARRAPARPIMRHDLKALPRLKPATPAKAVQKV
jgi:hypothetical protein